MNILGNVVEHYVLLSAVIFTIGGIGFLVRRNVLVQLMSIELMLNAVNLARHERAGFFLLHHRGGCRRGSRGPGHRAGFLPLEAVGVQRRGGSAPSLRTSLCTHY